MDIGSLRRRYTDLLLERVEETQFPSNDMLNRIEMSLSTDEHAERYVAVLMERVEQTRYPSVQLLDRISRLLDQLATVSAARAAGQNGRR